MDNQWVRLLAYVTGLVNQELLLQNEYLVVENRILKAHLQPRYRLTDSERATLAEVAKRLGAKLSRKWPISLNPIPCSLGTAGSSLTSSMVRNSAGPWGDRASILSSRTWLCAWHARIPAGDTTGLWERWPT